MSINPDAAERRTGTVPSPRAALWRLAGPWWLFLVTGIAWLIISVMVLRFTTASVTTVGVLLGVLFLLGALNEFMIAGVRHSWRWAHILLGILIVKGVGCCIRPPVQCLLVHRLRAGTAAHLQGRA